MPSSSSQIRVLKGCESIKWDAGSRARYSPLRVGEVEKGQGNHILPTPLMTLHLWASHLPGPGFDFLTENTGMAPKLLAPEACQRVEQAQKKHRHRDEFRVCFKRGSAIRDRAHPAPAHPRATQSATCSHTRAQNSAIHQRSPGPFPRLTCPAERSPTPWTQVRV